MCLSSEKNYFMLHIFWYCCFFDQKSYVEEFTIVPIVFYCWFCFICQIRLFTIYSLYLTVVTVIFCCLSDESFQSTNNELRELPAVELTTLPLILKVWALFYSPCLFLWIFNTKCHVHHISLQFVFSLPTIILVKIGFVCF